VALAEWVEKFGRCLPPATARFLSMTGASLGLVAEIFDSLSDLVVAQRGSHPDEQRVSLGPAAAAKTIFALRPDAFAPWDAATRRAFGHNGSGKSYVAYLKDVQANLPIVERQCEPLHLALDELVPRLGREGSTAPQLIDDCHSLDHCHAGGRTTRTRHPSELAGL